MTLLITGGAGFIGSNFVLDWIQSTDESIVNLDKLTYAGNLQNFQSISDNPQHIFVRGDMGDAPLVEHLLKKYSPRGIINFAAESHVDRSIYSASDFIQTNIVSTFSFLDSVRKYWTTLDNDIKKDFRFLHISTDEVFGSLERDSSAFTEDTPYQPNNPYSASKAASDHIVRAYHHTYGLPVLTTNCSNNYGSFQFPEKLIPLIIHRALSGGNIPIYGDGKNIRDWVYVGDHCAALRLVLEKGICGETYNIGGNTQKTNIEVALIVCTILDNKSPRKDGELYSSQIAFVNDRLGHDRRYAIDSSKIRNKLGWSPRESFDTGIIKTIEWYLDNSNWMESIENGSYRNLVTL